LEGLFGAFIDQRRVSKIGPHGLHGATSIKVAPFQGGNPGAKLMKIQLEACMKLLEAELANWKPRAAVFLTEVNKRSGHFDRVDDDGWFAPFRNRLGIEMDDSDLSGGKRALVRAGRRNVAGHPIRIVVTLRPESLTREELSRQIVAAINGSAK
jgi:hypothetical protein